MDNPVGVLAWLTIAVACALALSGARMLARGRRVAALALMLPSLAFLGICVAGVAIDLAGT